LVIYDCKERWSAVGIAGFLTTEDVVAYLNVTPRTIYRLIRTGEPWGKRKLQSLRRRLANSGLQQTWRSLSLAPRS